MSSLLTDDPALADEQLIPAPTPAVPAEVVDHVVRGTSTLGAAVFIERGSTFLANVLAVRMAGPAVFGAYSLGITTANNISTYAAGGIGTTATRFSGKYPFESGSYRVFAQVMATISLASAALAALALSLGAGMIAQLLHKPELTGLLHWAAITASGMVLLECVRGFFVGQRRLLALGMLSILVGVGMLLCIPTMAHTGHATAMVIAHGAVTLSAVALCCVFASPLSLLPRAGGHAVVAFGTLLREVWTYGVTQLAGLVSANVAGWWITALVARSDASLVQVSFFAIASQLRNIIGLVPSLLTEGSFASMARPEEDGDGVPQRVMLLCTFASTAISFLIAAVVAIGAPLLIRLLYGSSYLPAALTVTIAVFVAVVQMGNAPPSARLSVVSIRSTAVVNTVWAAATAVIGTVWMLRHGSAAVAMAVFLIAHILIAAMVLGGLARRDRVPAGLVELFAGSTLAVIATCLLAAYRAAHPALIAPLTTAMAAVTGITLLWLYRFAKQHGCLPSSSAWAAVLRRAGGPFRRLTSRRGSR